jgi:hypothetical protein
LITDTLSIIAFNYSLAKIRRQIRKNKFLAVKQKIIICCEVLRRQPNSLFQPVAGFSYKEFQYAWLNI